MYTTLCLFEQKREKMSLLNILNKILKHDVQCSDTYRDWRPSYISLTQWYIKGNDAQTLQSVMHYMAVYSKRK